MNDQNRDNSVPAQAPAPRPGIPPVVFSNPGAVDDPEPMPARPQHRRPTTTRRRDG
ncbi:hypothetical protein [Actinoplanes xinjiangensis]|uniref:hypothetical protein n=1 Tax=Actinoplanes xinjiangensis TaxID=512350 RepID=UPI0034433121